MASSARSNNDGSRGCSLALSYNFFIDFRTDASIFIHLSPDSSTKRLNILFAFSERNNKQVTDWVNSAEAEV